MRVCVRQTTSIAPGHTGFMSTTALVDPLIGTDSHHDLSFGNVLPITALPWGTHHFAPVNADDARWFFQYRAWRFQGLRLTHQPSPWMGDWCHATVMPQSGPLRPRGDERAIDVASRDLACTPHRFACMLPSAGIALTAAPTMHGLAMQVRFTGHGPRRIILDSAAAGSERGGHATTVQINVDRGEVVLTTASGANLHDDFRLHLVLRISGATVRGGGIFDSDGEHSDQSTAAGAALGAWLELDPDTTVAEIRLAGSFIDTPAARRLLAAELGDHSVNQVANAAQATWDALLDRLETPGLDPDRERLLRTAIYRTLLFPRRLDEPDDAGQPRHRCPDTGVVRAGVRVTDNGFWDTARTVYPWYALFCPDHLPTILEGWLAGARSTGWLASWASPGHRSCMTGSYSDAVFADALARGISGWDPAEALQYLRRHVEVPVSEHDAFGRLGIADYLAHGYVPVEACTKATARTLDYAYGDWCLATVATAAGDHAFAASCRERAGWWRNVFDPATGFFRGRQRDGSWQEPFDPLTWGGPFVEGSAWQFAWHVPHDHAGLIAAHGGPTRAHAALERLLAEPPRFHVGTYGTVIHEMREMAQANFGQYAHSNQPSHFTLPYLAHCGATGPWRRTVQRVLTELHRPQPDGLPGDEDNGELSAWWLCAALGLFPDCPGSDGWLRVRPLIRTWRLRRPDGRVFGIETVAERDSEHDDHWQRDDGHVATALHLTHATVATGGLWRVSDR